MRVDRSEFVGNQSDAMGGAIITSEMSATEITCSRFARNRADFGGAIYGSL